ncbi:hypothetical protein [Paenibacillus piri]|nr:hypothetical protein [Paenibacillus piri]
MNNKKRLKLRIIWLIPNLFMYAMFVGLSCFILLNAEGLMEIERMGIWLFMLFMLLGVAVLGSIRIYIWIKQGKM